MMTKLLIVEDEPSIREMIRYALSREGYDVAEAGDASEARHEIAENRPDLLIVDWMLPETSGVELVRSLRRDDFSREIPVLMLTARGEEEDKVTGLEAGADDYMVKPVAIREMSARIRALLRRAGGRDEGEVFTAGPITLDVAAHSLSIGDEIVDIGNTEFKLLNFFMAHPGRVYSRAKLLDFVWGQNVYVEERTVDVHILRLRKVLKPFGVDGLVHTVRGAGYRFNVT